MDINQTPVTSSECAVCGHNAHGIHFGVLSCRACAAFFRRTVVMNKKYKCKKTTMMCDFKKSERYICRMCRYNKCISLGMTPDNVQWNRDTFPRHSVNESPSPELSLQPGYCKDSHMKMPSLFDLTSTLEFISTIFDKNEPSVSNDESCYYNSLNTLEKMNYGLQQYRNGESIENITFNNKLSLDDLAKRWAEQMYRVANWLMHSEAFRKTSMDDKLTIFQITWSFFQRFERLNMGVEIFGQSALDEKILLISDGVAVNLDNLETDISSITDQPLSVFKNMFRPFSYKLISDVAKPLYGSAPTSIELTYMLYLIVWRTVGKEMGGKMKDIGEKCTEEVWDNLHEYYIKDRRTRNYAARLVKLNSIVYRYQQVQAEHKNIVELANLFDFFKAKMFEPYVFSTIKSC